MFQGKTETALRLITEQNAVSVLHLDSNISGGMGSVCDALLSKHPHRHSASISALLNTTTEPPDFHPVVFEAIDATTIKTAAMHAQMVQLVHLALMPVAGDVCVLHFIQPQLNCTTHRPF